MTPGEPLFNQYNKKVFDYYSFSSWQGKSINLFHGDIGWLCGEHGSRFDFAQWFQGIGKSSLWWMSNGQVAVCGHIAPWMKWKLLSRSRIHWHPLTTLKRPFCILQTCGRIFAHRYIGQYRFWLLWFWDKMDLSSHLSEIENKNTLYQGNGGIKVKYKNRKLELGLNTLYTYFHYH